MTTHHSPKPTPAAWSWCAHVDHHDIRDRPRRRDVPRLAVWHKLAGPWSRFTFCGQDARWMAPRKWLRTTTPAERPAVFVGSTEGVQPSGLFCEACQSLTLHHLVPPGFPKFREPADCLVSADWWEERGDARAELLRQIAEPDWKATLDAEAVVYGPWGRENNQAATSHLWRRAPQLRGNPVIGSPDAGFHLFFDPLCLRGPSLATLSIAWEFDEPRLPCGRCTEIARERPLAHGNYAPFRNAAMSVIKHDTITW